jgi:FMN phosphatase YigB (HAD superfamily)
MRKALASLGTGFSDICYFGDAAWDRAAAKELGWNFIPVGRRLAGIEEYRFQNNINFFPDI